jgi:hypothetical protein
MRLSFVLTTRDGSPDPRPALEALAGCLQPGDEIIAVDAASEDGTTERLEDALAQLDFGPDIRIVPILLGTASPDRAIALNVGIDAAEAEALLLLADGVLPDAGGISAARRAMEAVGANLLISMAEMAACRITEPVSDGIPVARIAPELPLTREEILHRALMYPPEPERMIFRRALLSRNGNFTETSPLATSIFRWQLMDRAGRVAAWPTSFCLGSAGAEHEETHDPFAVLAHCDILRREGRDQALLLSWLCGHMMRDIHRLSGSNRLTYACALSRILEATPRRIWRRAMAAMPHPGALSMAEALRRGETMAIATLWTQEAGERLLQTMAERIEATAARLKELSATQDGMGRRIESLCRIAEFDALNQMKERPRNATSLPDDPSAAVAGARKESNRDDRAKA